MVIGNGMIATRFSNYAENGDVLIFASGVSHSASATATDFARERALLLETMQLHPGKLLVYFSTCSVYDPSLHAGKYVIHKLEMEALIKQHARSWLIFRVSNPVGNTQNTATVLNYFAGHILQQQHFELWEAAARNLIDLDDMFTLCHYFIQKPVANEVINIASPVNYPVQEIVQALEKQLQQKADFTLVDKGSSPVIDTTQIQPLFTELNIHFPGNYLEQLLQKYFPAA